MSDDLVGYLADATDNAKVAAKAATALLPLVDKTDDAIRRLAAVESAMRRMDLATLNCMISDVRAAAELSRVAAEKSDGVATELTKETAFQRRKRPWNYALAAAIVSLLVPAVFVIGWLTATWHLDDQVNAARESLRVEMASTTAWAGTPIGQRAQALDKIGTLAILLNCDRAGWKTSKTDGRLGCIPAPKEGWFLN